MKKVWLGSALAAIMAVTAACGGGESEGEQPSGTDAEETADTTGQDGNSDSDDDGSLSGEIAIDGSSTVFPIMEAVSEEYRMENPDVQAPVGVSGSGGGFEKFIAGETDLSNASRPIKEEEAAALEENGIDYIELPLAYDGLSVVVSQENDFVDSLTIDELKKIWVEGGAKTWKDVRPEWPDKPIERFSPGTDSGTFDYFNEVILEEEDIAKDAQLSEDDNVLVNGVMGSPNAIGYFGYAYYAENQDALKAVPIDNGDGAVAPSEETINDGSYEPLSRPLFTYVKVDALKEPHIRDYVEFTNDIAGEMALEVGYVNMPEEEYEANQQKIEEAAKAAE